MSRYIDADNLISVLDILSDKGGDIRYWEQLKTIVDSMPTADVQEIKRGRWIEVNDDDSLYKCSACGELSCCNSPYCGECGAKMDEVAE